MGYFYLQDSRISLQRRSVRLACFYRSSASEFLALSEGELLACLSREYAKRGYTTQYTDQTLTWEQDLRLLRTALEKCIRIDPVSGSWEILLEFSVPRKEMRIDAVLLINSEIVILEAKTGAAFSEARRQLQEYALLLYFFHNPPL